MVWWIVAGLIAWELVEDVRGTSMMMMFILEEAIQTAMMGMYLASKEKMVNQMEDLDRFVRYYLSDSLLDLSRHGVVGRAAYPLGIAYEAFALATNRALDNYRNLVEKWKKEGVV